MFRSAIQALCPGFLAAVFLLFPAQASPPLLIANARLLDPVQGELSRPSSLLVAEGHIAAIGDDALTAEDTIVLDADGAVLVPGLTDMHVHIWDEAELGAYLSYGVTAVRNLSGMPFHLDMARAVEAGELEGPHMSTSGPILNGSGPNAQPNHQIVNTPAEARASVRQQYRAGYRLLKVYSNLSRASYEAVREEAATLGMAIAGHPPEGVRQPGMPFERPFSIAFEELLDDDFATIEHVESIVWHAMRGRYDADSAPGLARQLADARLVVTPTLLAFRNLVRVAETKGAYLHRPGTDMLNPVTQQLEAENQARWSQEDAVAARRQYRQLADMTRQMDEAGVRLVTGSDAGIFTNIPGASLIDELRLLDQAGIGADEILRIATVNSGQANGAGLLAGRLLAGAPADLVLLASDPRDDWTVFGAPRAVIVGGRLYDMDALARLRSAAARPDVARTRANLSAGLRAQGIDPVELLGQ
ncbi:hypothetical protein B5C34_08530 [Pacificimonas flava]|uniref:Amidohydrolase-related domain-containing protein n=2 Tax=Pacificimonas TaxID=1960290 RepID=A0A219B6S9_9SPHN|nr:MULTISPECIES: amidohydrolase family protein [Pacificimonas]MBZ6379291.1 amidohydrolase family protein [Pacificimonas aurantium]OWV33499.1 hypothetical protein B5C34_08530 [Pacificimonas flava]